MGFTPHGQRGSKLTTPPLVRSLEILGPEAQATVLADAGLRALFALVDRKPDGAPKESVAAAVAGRTVWQFRGAMTRLTGCSWRDFLRILHLRERRARGPNLLKKAKTIAADAGFPSLKCMRAAESWARRAHANLHAPLDGAHAAGGARTGSVLQIRGAECQ